MPSLDQIVARIRLALDQRLPDKPVRRTVHGVEMLLPRRHARALPIFARPGTPYARNLLDLARLLGAAEGHLCVLDVGANVGDSALFILRETAATIVCVEPDPRWIDYLEQNVGSNDNVVIERSVIVGSSTGPAHNLAIVHQDVGTSQVSRVPEATHLSTLSPAELLARHPQLADVRLIKSDTDGYDIMIVPALARTFLPSRPVIFFEFDPRPTRIATPELDPDGIWDALIECGYEQAVVWDNGGSLIGAWPTAECRERSSVLDSHPRQRGYGFWDVAVAHREHETGLRVLEALAR